MLSGLSSGHIMRDDTRKSDFTNDKGSNGIPPCITTSRALSQNTGKKKGYTKMFLSCFLPRRFLNFLTLPSTKNNVDLDLKSIYSLYFAAFS